jgi:hypothetical protein
VLEPADLPDHGSRLDAFGGPGDRRATMTVATVVAPIAACTGVLAGERR